jgi:proteasome accessory factor C
LDKGAKGTPPGERLRRLLLAVPYIVGNPGVRVDTVAERFAIPRDELIEDLGLLFITGTPPYSPGDLIDIDIDEDDRVTITMADYFARPFAMTRPEALDLTFRLRAAGAAMDGDAVLGSALAKLEAILGESGESERIETMPLDTPDHVEAVADAAAEHRVIRITYHAASSGARTEREIEPEEVFLGIGAWYVDAWDRSRDAERLFRIDRISEVRDTGTTFTPRGLRGSDRPLYRPLQDDTAVRLRLAPAARWVAEYYTVEDPVEAGDDLVVTLRSSHRAWLLRLLLRLGPHATVVDSPEVAEEAGALAASILARYRGGAR